VTVSPKQKKNRRPSRVLNVNKERFN